MTATPKTETDTPAPQAAASIPPAPGAGQTATPAPEPSQAGASTATRIVASIPPAPGAGQTATPAPEPSQAGASTATRITASAPPAPGADQTATSAPEPSQAGASTATRITASAPATPAPGTPAVDRRAAVFDFLDRHAIAYHWYEHPKAPTIEIARQHWRNDGSKHCKNLFFRNHKGDRHYLVCFDCELSLPIHDLERRLHQGKLSFASEQRMERWLGLCPGSVSPFGLINDPAHHVHLFLDARLRDQSSYSFHPNDCRATVVIAREEFLRYLSIVGNTCEFIELY